MHSSLTQWRLTVYPDREHIGAKTRDAVWSSQGSDLTVTYLKKIK